MSVEENLLHGKIVLVTGGGSGIGLAFVQQAVRRGARVIVADLCLSEAFAPAVRAYEESVRYVHTDVRRRKDLENAITASVVKFGDVPDIYIANAGVFEPQWSNFWLDTEEDSYATAEISSSYDYGIPCQLLTDRTADFLHPLKLTRLATRASLGARKPGTVALVSSTVGLSWSYPAALYCATKHALVGFTRSMAPSESLNGIRVVCLCPGIVDTPLWQGREGLSEQFSVSAEVCISPDRVAAALLQLVTEEKYHGGTVLRVDTNGVSEIAFGNKTREMKDEDLEKVKSRSFAPVQNTLLAEVGIPWAVGPHVT